MAIIIDANCAPVALKQPPSEEFRPVMKAILDGKQKLAVGGSKQKHEYRKLHAVWMYIQLLDQAGKAFLVKDESVDAEELDIQNRHTLASDDPHLLALARVSGARLLCSLDKALHADFCNPAIINKPRGYVYQVAAHAHLISKC